MRYCKLQSQRRRFVRRAALAALLATSFWQTNAIAENPAPITLELLPPLPVSMGQIGAVQPHIVLKNGVNINPFCDLPLSTITLVSGELEEAAPQPAPEVLTLQSVTHAIDESLDAADDKAELVRPGTTLKLSPVFALPTPPILEAPPQPAAELVAPQTVAADATVKEAITASDVTLVTAEEEPVTFSFSDESASGADQPTDEVDLTIGTSEDPDTAFSFSDGEADEFAKLRGLPKPVKVEPAPLETANVEGLIAIPRLRSNPLFDVEKPSRPINQVDAPRSEASTATSAAQENPFSKPSRQTPAIALDQRPIVVGPSAVLDTTAELVGAPSGLVIDVPRDVDPATVTTVKPIVVRKTGVAIQPVSTSEESIPVAERNLFDEGLLADVTIELAKASVQPLKVNQSIKCFAVEDDTVCQVLPAGVNELRIIGQQSGVTRLAVWVGTEEEARPMVYSVRVDQGPETELQGLEVTAETLTKTLRATFPGSRARVVATDKQLAIQGLAANDDEARSMLQLVRQTCLVPVLDQLSTR